MVQVIDLSVGSFMRDQFLVLFDHWVAWIGTLGNASATNTRQFVNNTSSWLSVVYNTKASIIHGQISPFGWHTRALGLIDHLV